MAGRGEGWQATVGTRRRPAVTGSLLGERGWFRVPEAAPTTERERELWRAREGAEARRLQDEQERRTTEEAWRKAFQTARQQLARQQLPEAEQQLKAAREQLDDLERAASRQGIPREWR